MTFPNSPPLFLYGSLLTSRSRRSVRDWDVAEARPSGVTECLETKSGQQTLITLRSPIAASLLPRTSCPTHGTRGGPPEFSLVAAIFEDAVRCVHRASRGVTDRQFLDAVEWIASERGDWPFAFVNVCGFLGVDAAAVRKRLRIWDERVERDSRARVTQKADARSHAA
jgi:hypothetical protein